MVRRGGSIIVTQKDKTGDPQIDAKTDQSLDVLEEVIESRCPGRGALYGIEIYTKTAARMRELDLPGIGKHRVEQSFSAGDTVRYGLDGRVRTDFRCRNGRTSAALIRAIWDRKAGRAKLTSKRVRELSGAVGVDDSVPVIEIHIDRGIAVKNHISCNFTVGVAHA